VFYPTTVIPAKAGIQIACRGQTTQGQDFLDPSFRWKDEVSGESYFSPETARPELRRRMRIGQLADKWYVEVLRQISGETWSISGFLLSQERRKRKAASATAPPSPNLTDTTPIPIVILRPEPKILFVSEITRVRRKETLRCTQGDKWMECQLSPMGLQGFGKMG